MASEDTSVNEDLNYEEYLQYEMKYSVDYFEHLNDFEDSEYEILKNCLFSSLVQVYPVIIKCIFVNLLFCLLYSSGRIKERTFHVSSALCGLYLLNTIESLQGKIIVICCISSSYFLLSLCNILYKKFDRISSQYYGVTICIKCALIVCLVLCEFFLIDPEVWMQIRGPMMVFSMKLISLIDDLDRTIRMPNIFQYFGYCFSGANIIFGPFVPFNHYLHLFRHPAKKDISWLWGILRAVSYSVLFLTISNCWGMYFISEYHPHFFLRSYREALSFRTSHYFISFLSEASMLSAGFKESHRWRYTVTNPFVIEFPTALPIVVTKWNKPMHYFLKKYVYRPCVARYGRGIAMVTTFVISSFLHGFEIKVSVVLITIGIMAYLQYRVRKTISIVFNMCFRVHPCKENCSHGYKRNHIFTRLLIGVYSVFTVIHLVFLGVLMDPSTAEIGIIEKWKRLQFIGLMIAAIDFLMGSAV